MNSHSPSMNVSALLKASQIIECVLGNSLGATASDVLDTTSMTKSSAHRTIVKMEAFGWLQKDCEGEITRWYLSDYVLQMAFNWKRYALSQNDDEELMSMKLPFKPNSQDALSKSLYLFHLVYESGFKGRTLNELYKAGNCPRSTAQRILRTWELLGWLRPIKVDGKREVWCASSKLIELANAYEHQVRSKVYQLQDRYQQITGEVF